MSRYSRENPEEALNHDWFQTARRTEANLCLRCGQRPKLPPLLDGSRVVFQSNLCRQCEDEAGKQLRERFDGGTMTTFTDREGRQLTRIFPDPPGAPRMPQ